MRSTLRTLGFSLSLAVTALVGCAAPPSEDAGDAQGASSQGATNVDVRKAIADATTSAVLLERGTTTSITKVNKLAALTESLQLGELTPANGVPRCPPAWSIKFLDKDGKDLGALQRCGDAYLTVGTKVFTVALKDGSVKRAFGKDVGEMLEGVDELERTDEGSTKSPNVVRTWVSAFADSLPDPDAQVTHQEELGVYTFLKDGVEVAQFKLYMPANEDDLSGPAKMTVDGKDLGWVTFDMGTAFGLGGR